MQQPNTKKIKVLIVAGSMECGGLENQLMYLIRNADKNEFQFDFTVHDKNAYYYNEIVSLGGCCHIIPETRRIHLVKYCKELYKVIKHGNYDIIHSNELFHSGIVLSAAKFAGVKNRFVHAHNIAEGDGGSVTVIRKIYNFVMRFLILRYATDFCACSTPAGEFLYGKNITSNENFHLIFNSADVSEFIEKYHNKETGEFCDDEWKNVIQVSRFSDVKNQLFTADIARIFKNSNKKIRFICAGDDKNDYGATVKQKIADNGLREYMILPGVRSDIGSLERKSNAFILPSLYEGMPLALIEAQSSGLPCVTADTYSREADFGIGYVEWLPLGDVQAWAEAVERAVNKPRASKSSVVKAIDEKGFSSFGFSTKVLNLYRNAINRNNKN